MVTNHIAGLSQFICDPVLGGDQDDSFSDPHCFVDVPSVALIKQQVVDTGKDNHDNLSPG